MRPDPANATAAAGDVSATPDGTYTVMMVCLGNICRSPMAAAVLRARLAEAGLDDRIEVRSSGTGSWHVGAAADHRAAATLAKAGYDTTHTARQFDPEEARDVDLILAMDSENLADLRFVLGPDDRLRMLRSFDPTLAGVPEGSQLDVPDPYYGGADGFREVLSMIERAVDGLLATMPPPRQ